MQEQLLFGFLAPIIAFLISMNFFVFWSRQTEARHILAFAGAFALCSLSILLSHNLIPGLSYPNIIIAVVLDTVSLGLLILGSCARAKIKTPYALISATGVVGLIAGYIAITSSDLAALRLAPVNGVQAVLLFVCGWIWLKDANSEQISNHRSISVILFTFAIFCAAFPFVMYAQPNAPLAANYQHSVSWMLFNFGIILMVMVAGLSIVSILTDDMLKIIRSISSTDLLTGLKTRRAFEEEYEAIFRKLERSPLPLSMIIADIDHFKSVNDTYGHQTGDRVIATFGKLLTECSRETDLVARIGGEEFCIVLWNADAAGARLVAENMRTQFQTAQFEGMPKHKKLTSSFGVATLKNGEIAEELYHRADQALYLAKEEGRNRVCLDQTHLEPVTPEEQSSTTIVQYPSA